MAAHVARCEVCHPVGSNPEQVSTPNLSHSLALPYSLHSVCLLKLTTMSKKSKAGRNTPDLMAQDGRLPLRHAKEHYKEAACKFFAKAPAKDLLTKVTAEMVVKPDLDSSEAGNTMPLEEDAADSMDWHTVSTQYSQADMAPMLDQGRATPDPTLRKTS